MAFNNVAKGHYDNSVAWLNLADETEDLTTQLAYASCANVALGLAWFAVQNHAVVIGIDEGLPGPVMQPHHQNPATPAPVGGPKVWGGRA